MKTECPQNHEYTDENTYVTPQGYRQCKTCRRERMRARRPVVEVRESGARGARGLNNAAKTSCPQGHEYTEENTYRNPEGRRWCRTCMKANGKVQNVKRYGITPEILQEMLVAQDYKCLICPRSFTDFVPHVDHDHTCCPGGGSCGKCIRGLLCIDCNRGLGQFRDTPEFLTNAAAYLECRAL